MRATLQLYISRSIVLTAAEDGRPSGGFVDSDALKDTAAVMEGVRKDMYRGLFPGHDPAVHPDIVSPHSHQKHSFAGLIFFSPR